MPQLKFYILLTLQVMLFAVGAHGATPLQQQMDAFSRFKASESCKASKCRNNVINFVLEELVPKNIPFKEGYIVTFLNNHGEINYFNSAASDGYDSRTKTRERWSTGQQFFPAKFFYHTFIVLDGRVFDMSVRGGVVQKLSTSLTSNFLPPKGATGYDENGTEISRRSQIEELSESGAELTVHRIDTVKKLVIEDQELSFPSKYSLGEPAYVGRPLDLFIHSGALDMRSVPTEYRAGATRRLKKFRELVSIGEFLQWSYRPCYELGVRAWRRHPKS